MDRPELREKIAETLIIQKGWSVAITKRNPPVWQQFLKEADQILALIPDEKEIRKQQQVEDTKYYAEMMKKATDRVSKEAKKQERERIRKLFEDDIAPFVSLKDTTRLYKFWQALMKGEK